MNTKFVSILQSFFPKGKAWEFQTNFGYLIDGTSEEFGRSYDTASQFYRDFDIVNSVNLASEHGSDYLIKPFLFTNSEIQRIIVEYLNKDMTFKQIIEDFAGFIGASVGWDLPPYFEFGYSQFGDEFGAESAVGNLYVVLDIGNVTCQQYQKIRWLVEYLKPPYINVELSDPPLTSIVPLTFGYSQFGDDFGEMAAC